MLELLLSVAVLISTSFTILLLLLPSRHTPASSTASRGGTLAPQTAQNAASSEPRVSVQVLVLGDIGRSPRMQYHAMSIAKHGGKVDMIGYLGQYIVCQYSGNANKHTESPLHPGLIDNPLITIIPLALPPPLIRSSSIPFLLTGPAKVLWQTYTLFRALAYTTTPSAYLLVQNPPSIPVLAISYLTSFLRNTSLIIDWHNYGWTILASKRGSSHPFVRISKAYETLLGQWAPAANFTVSHAMARQLSAPPYNIRTPIFTLHDRPAEVFQPVKSQKARAEFLARLPNTSEYAEAIVDGSTKLLVSSTSWTPDEDFSLLLDALMKYSSSATATTPRILALITGKGPDKAKYLSQISALESSSRLSHVKIRTAWLTTEDYAMLLACADLGVCLHMSSSGVDLPMKVVDMFGAGLPVVGYEAYESWSELVTEGVNGRGFKTADELADVLEELFGTGEGESRLGGLKEGALVEGKSRWDEEWDGVAGRLLGLC